MEDSIVSICSSCSKSFGLYRRKHHCRLDGSVICNLCSQFLSFSIASRYLLFYRVFFRYHLRILEWIINLNLSSFSITDELSFQRLINHKGLTSSTIANDGLNEDTLRICVSCTQILQRYYKKIYFMNTSKDELFHHYEVKYFLLICNEYKRICSRKLFKHKKNMKIFIRSIQL